LGQQQLLLIILAILVVGVAILLGINMFRSHAVETKRENIITDCVNLSGLAQQYYSRPKAMGGGGRSFEGWVIPAELRENANGRFEITDISQPLSFVEITAIGNEEVTAGDSVSVKIKIFPRDFQITILH
jgi:hypothetical protein